jgi:hypothetical protein
VNRFRFFAARQPEMDEHGALAVRRSVKEQMSVRANEWPLATGGRALA